LFAVRPEDIVDLAADVTDRRHIRHMPAEDACGNLVGVVSHRDLRRLFAGEREHVFGEMLVSDVMRIGFDHGRAGNQNDRRAVSDARTKYRLPAGRQKQKAHRTDHGARFSDRLDAAFRGAVKKTREMNFSPHSDTGNEENFVLCVSMW
jgi:CBS domain-containing protein